MPRRSAQLPSISAKVRRATNAQNRAEIELGELEREINENRDRPLSIVLKGVIDRVRSLTDADGAAIALRDAWGVVCRASSGEAPDVGSRLHPESSLTRECFESGQAMICEDTEEDSRVRLAAKSLRLRWVRQNPRRRRQYREDDQLPKPEKRRASRPLIVLVLMFHLPRHPHLRPLSLSSRVADRPNRLRRHQARSRWPKISAQRCAH